MAGPRQAELFSVAASDGKLIVINERCVVRTEDGHRVVLVNGMPSFHYAGGDHMAEAHAMVGLVEQGWAAQVEVARAFGCDVRTVRRHQQRFEAGGLAALGRTSGYPAGRPRIAGARTRLVSRWKAEGVPTREIARRLGVCENAVRKVLRRLGWQPSVKAAQLPLPDGEGADPNLSGSTTSSSAPPAAAERGAHPNLSAPAAPADESDLALPSFDRDPSDRRLDRLFAYLGLLDDAAPLFQSGACVPGAGVLLAVPALVQSGVFEVARRVYGSIGPAFYGLRTTILTLLLMALLRIKRAEALKEHSPQDLGRVLGLDRAPETKTLRRKLTRLAALQRATDFGRRLAAHRLQAHGPSLGFLYLDGHVRVYHGQEPIPKTHVARMRLAMPGTTDYWVNDAAGEPLFVVTAEANAGLTKVLPTLLTELRALLGERRATVVFDRGGWSPRLFATIIAGGFDILTYRKGRIPRVARRRFAEHVGSYGGREVRYTLADQSIRLLRGKLTLRQVTRLSDQHQTAIVTSRRDLSAVEVAGRMFDRWRQENFFKYLREEYALDALVEHATEPADPTREVPNPAWQELNAKLTAARTRLVRIVGRCGLPTAVDTILQTPARIPVVSPADRAELARATQAVLRLEARRDRRPRRIPVGERDDKVVRLATERQHLSNVLKMVAYQAETDLLRHLAPHYRRADDEGRTLVQAALGSAADIALTDDELRVTLAPLSSPHRTHAVAALCDELNRLPVVFPGTRLRLRYRVRPAPKRTL